LRPGDKAEAKRRLQQQGIHAVDISFFGEAESKEDAAGGKGASNTLAALAKRQTLRRNPAQLQHAAGVALGANVRRDPISGMIIDDDGQSKAASKKSRRQKLPEPSAGLQQVLARMKGQLKARGASGMIGLGRKFRIMDDDGSKSLSLAEFKKALQELALDLTDSEGRSLFTHFDADGSGTIDYEEFIQGVRDPLNDRRRGLVQMAFRVLDKDGSGTIEPSEIASAYDASKHPEVMAKRKTPQQVYAEFLDTFDVGGDKDGKVTAQEFENYYTNISASIDNDDYFELMIRNCWHLSGGKGWSENSSNLRVLVTHSDGRQSVQEIKDDLGIKAGDTQEMIRRLRAQGVDVVGVSFKGNVEESPPSTPSGGLSSLREAAVAAGTKTADRNALRRGKKSLGENPAFNSNVSFNPNEVVPPSSLASFAGPSFQSKHSVLGVNPALQSQFGRGFQVDGAESKFNKKPVQEAKNAFQSSISVGLNIDRSNAADFKPAEPAQSKVQSLALLSGYGDVSALLDSLKEKLAARGVRGIVSLARRFKIMDDDNSKSISFPEFRKGLMECALDLPDQSMQQLFRHFDKDKNGSVDYEEFLISIRGSLNPRRRAMVQLVFSRLDKNGNGVLEPEELLDKYDATQHPDVRAGRRSSNEVLQEFLDTFEVGGEVDGKVTESEFLNYYSNVSASIDEDDYFELMMRNAWHVSGGEGWCANSTNRRVLVTHADGRQTVEEIKDDLGIRAGDQDAMMKNLRTQSFNAHSISLTWANDECKTQMLPSPPQNTKGVFVSPTFRSTFTLG